MFEHTIEIRVRYGETDRMGNVYYGMYALYYEQGRTEMMRQLGISYKSLEEAGYLLPVVEMHARFIKPARYDEVLKVKTILKELPTRKITFFNEIYNSDEELINTGRITLLFVDAVTRKTCSPPAELIQALKPYFSTPMNPGSK